MTRESPNRENAESKLIGDSHQRHKESETYFNDKWVRLARYTDRFLSLLYSTGGENRNAVLPKPEVIIILESHLIGDVIMGLPAYRAIRETFPDAELIFWGNNWGKDLLQSEGIFDKFVVSRIPWAVYDYSPSNLINLADRIRDLRRMKINIAVDFRGDIRNILLLYLLGARTRVSYDFTGGSYWLTHIVPPPKSYHIIDRNLNVAQFLGADGKSSTPKIDVPPAKVAAARAYLENKDLYNIVFIHPGASQPKKLWPADRFAQIVDYLHNKGYSPILLAGPNDKAIIESMQNKSKGPADVLSVPLSKIAAYLACGEFFIGLDSGIGHIAAAVGIDVIILFGPQPPSIACPRGRGKIVEIKKGDFDCRPCHKQVCDFNNACMKAIAVEDVIAAIDSIERDVVFQ